MRFNKNGLAKVSILMFFFTVFALSASAYAQGNLHIGRTSVDLGLKYNGDFDNNIFRDADNEESDYIHTVTPSIKLIYAGTSPGNFFRAGYDLGIVRYSDFGDNDYERHKLNAAGGYRAPAGFYLKADDFYLQTADPYGSASFYGEGQRTERWNNTFNLALGYDFAEVYTVEVFARHFIEKYKLDADKFQDRTRVFGGATFLYSLSQKLRLLAELGTSSTTYDEQNDGIGGWNQDNSQDNKETVGLIGARFLPSGKLVGDLKVGASAVSYKNDADKNGNPYNEDTVPIGEAELSYFLSERTSFRAFAGRLRQSSRTANRSIDPSASYIDTFIGLGWSQGFLTKLKFDLEYSYRVEDYLNVAAGFPDKRLNRNRLNAGLNYDIRDWLDAGLTFDYMDKNATEDLYANDEYKATRYGFYVSLTY